MSDGKVTENLLKATQTKRTRGALDDSGNIRMMTAAPSMEAFRSVNAVWKNTCPPGRKATCSSKHMELRERPKECSKPKNWHSERDVENRYKEIEIVIFYLKGMPNLRQRRPIRPDNCLACLQHLQCQYRTCSGNPPHFL